MNIYELALHYNGLSEQARRHDRKNLQMPLRVADDSYVEIVKDEAIYKLSYQ